MLIPYRSVRTPCRKEKEIKKSIFIAQLFPVETEEEAQSILETVRKNHKDAAHHCWAWRIGTIRIREKSSDGGETQGTAGHPMLHVLQMKSLTNTLSAVTRYFGGIKLGTGGLARAYGGGANKCLQNAEKLPLFRRVELSCACDFNELALVKLRLAELNGILIDETFTANGVELQLALAEEHIAPLQQQLSGLSRGRILLHRSPVDPAE